MLAGDISVDRFGISVVQTGIPSDRPECGFAGKATVASSFSLIRNSACMRSISGCSCEVRQVRLPKKSICLWQTNVEDRYGDRRDLEKVIHDGPGVQEDGWWGMSSVKSRDPIDAWQHAPQLKAATSNQLHAPVTTFMFCCSYRYTTSEGYRLGYKPRAVIEPYKICMIWKIVLHTVRARAPL